MSPTRRSGLGKGLSSLIPADVETDGSTFREIDVDAVVPNRYQPRDHFDEETLSSLAASIAEVGVIQPIVVRATDEGYELIAGERRWRAARRANLPSIPAIIRDSDDLGSLETAVVENLHRQDLNALEEAAAMQTLIDQGDQERKKLEAENARLRARVQTVQSEVEDLKASMSAYVEDRIKAERAAADSSVAAAQAEGEARAARHEAAQVVTEREHTR